MKAISYKYFSNPTDFENWQKETTPDIISVSPVTSNIDVVNKADWGHSAVTIKSSQANYNLIIFVTFHKEI